MGRILPDLTKGKAMTEVENGKKRHGQRVLIEFLDQNMAAHSSPPFDIWGIRCSAKETDTVIELPVEAVKDNPVGLQLMMFGASVLARNAVNTEPDPMIAAEKMVDRIEGFKGGDYRVGGRGSTGVPQILRALERALVEAGRFTEEQIANALAKRLAQWRGEDLDTTGLADDEADKALSKHQSALRRTWIALPGVKEAVLAIQTERVTRVEPQGELESLL